MLEKQICEDCWHELAFDSRLPDCPTCGMNWQDQQKLDGV